MPIMKMNNQISKLLRRGLLGVAVAALFACTTDEITYNTGTKPDQDALENVFGKLRSSKSLRDRVAINLDQGGESATDAIYYRLSQAAPQAVSATAVADPSMVAVYNDVNKTKLLPLPVANVKIANGGNLVVAAGKRISDRLDVTFTTAGLEPGIYLLPIVVSQQGQDVAATKQVLYYGISVRDVDETNMPLDEEWMTVFYINTSEVQPHMADYVALRKQDATSFQTLSLTTLGNIINLRIVNVGYDVVTKRALLSPTTDIRYVLEHPDKYIRPMQDKGRKVCICIQGGGTGIGFCNMNDAQIADFVDQVKNFVAAYKLDGVNLWDEGSGYGKAGMPAVNTTSYPKLIKALRDALPGKLLTLADKGDPTSYFDDTQKTGGIEVGKHLDYVWPFYVSQDVPIVFANPYNPFASYPIESRNAIAGLAEEKYGNFAVPFYNEKSELFMDPNLDLWFFNMIMWGVERTNNIMVFDDLALPAAVSYENGCLNMMSNVYSCLLDYNFDDFSSTFTYTAEQRIPNILRKDGYNTFAKNW